MKHYKNYIIVSAALLVIYASLLIIPRLNKKDRAKVIFPKIKIDDITNFKIYSEKNPEHAVELAGSGGQWMVMLATGKYTADPVKISALKKAVAELRSQRSVTKNMADLPIYGLDDKTCINLEIYEGEKLYGHILVGKNARDFKSTYFKTFDGKEILISSETLVSVLRGGPHEWIDHVIFSISDSEAEEITLPKTKLIKKEDKRWYFADTEKLTVDDGKVTNYLNIFNNFRTNDFEFEKTREETGLVKPLRVLSLKTSDTTYEILQGNEEKQDVFVGIRINGNELPMIYRFNKNRLEGLLKTPDQFVLEKKDSGIIKK